MPQRVFGSSLHSIAERLCVQYEVDVEVVQFTVDVVEFLTSAVGLGYIWFHSFRFRIVPSTLLILFLLLQKYA